MKMKIGAPLPADYQVSHEDLAESTATLIAHALLPLFAESMGEDLARVNVAGIVMELAYVFDEGEITLGGKTYRPRIAFVDENGSLLPGASSLTHLHQLAEDPFEIDPEAKITFEEAEFVEE